MCGMRGMCVVYGVSVVCFVCIWYGSCEMDDVCHLCDVSVVCV